MKWFIAKIVFNMVNGEKKSRFEEQLRLVGSESIDDAFLKARAIGIGCEETRMHENELIKREFVDVAELLPIFSLQSGTEIYSQIHETEEAREYIHHVHQQGMALRLSAQQ